MTTTVPIPTTDLAVDDIQLGDIEQWMRPDREGIFAKLRAEAAGLVPRGAGAAARHADFPQGPGFWALTRYADVMQVSRDPDTFHSGAEHQHRRHARPRSPSASGR